jgi:DNA invertase Pin-like site-specific DNA recombinase
MAIDFITREDLMLALYTRISDLDKQGKGFSLSSQLDAMRDWARSQGHTVVAEFEETEGASPYSEGRKRTKLNQVIELAEQRKINALMYYEDARFTRSMVDGVILRDRLWNLGIRLFCFTPFQEIKTGEFGDDIMHVIKDRANQLFVEKSREASMRGYKEK